MSQERTEEPTPKKLRDARRKGEVARSRDLGTAAVVLAVAGALARSGERLAAAARQIFAIPLRVIEGTIALTPGAALEATLAIAAGAIAPVLGAALVAGTLAGLLQVGPLVAWEPIVPKLERLDPVRGARNLFSQRRFVELLKTLVTLCVVGAVAYLTIEGELRGIIGLAARDAHAALAAAGALVPKLLLRVGGAMLGIAVLDVLYQRWRFRQDQKMTKEEVRREHRESEGDPRAKQQRERMHREIVEHAAVEEVRRADVLIVNPTHLAVALRYDDQDGDEAPQVIAKGQDDLARRMMDAARESGIPIMRDVPLARALFEMEVGDEIPEALYEAVAAVLKAAWAEREEQSEGEQR